MPPGWQPAAREESFVLVSPVVVPRLLPLLAIDVSHSPPHCPLAFSGQLGFESCLPHRVLRMIGNRSP